MKGRVKERWGSAKGVVDGVECCLGGIAQELRPRQSGRPRPEQNVSSRYSSPNLGKPGEQVWQKPFSTSISLPALTPPRMVEELSSRIAEL